MFQMLSAKLTGKLTLKEKFQLIRDAGFDGVEPPSAMNQEEVLAARDATGLKIPSVVVTTHWKFPLSDPNPGNRQIGLDGLKQGLRDAKAYGASSVLLVPAVVNKQTSYSEAYTRCSEEIKKVIPLAEELGVVIAIENVWNWFLLSPREAVEFADSFKSPFVKWHFDVGNVVNTGWPEQWVRELGPRIVKVHVKEFSKKLRDTKGLREGFKVNLMEGDSDWPAVMAAFDSVNYKGWLIAEQWGAEDLTAEGYLSQISKKLDDILAV
jgi:L-ribulose-5-phosphate 3-epimerase